MDQKQEKELTSEQLNNVAGGATDEYDNIWGKAEMKPAYQVIVNQGGNAALFAQPQMPKGPIK